MNNEKTDTKVMSPQFLRKRKMMLVLPALVLPFITMAFWALGGGSGNRSQKPVAVSGLNMQLPNAHLKDDQSQTKLSFYEEADRDSIKLGQQMKSDSFFQFQQKDTSIHFEEKYLGSTYDPSPTNYQDPNEAKVYQKLAQLNQQLNSVPAKSNSGEAPDSENKPSSANKDDVVRLEKLMQHINNKDSLSDDPEMNNLNGMMEKILDIQHPERVKERQGEKIQNRENVFPVNKEPIRSSVSLIDTSGKNQNETNGFFGLEEESISKEDNAIEAVVHENQTLVNGSVIKLRLLNDISIDGNIVPKDNFVFGRVSLNDERLAVEISAIRMNHSLFPVKLAVYDMDGLPGIYIPGAITRDVAKQSLDNATEMMNLSSLDPSMKAQATAAGIEAAKALLSKKVKLVKVTVKAGYKVLLK